MGGGGAVSIDLRRFGGDGEEGNVRKGEVNREGEREGWGKGKRYYHSPFIN